MNDRMIQCTTVVDRDAVRRESIGGIEHIIVSSFTLPDNIVMNGILYPDNEIESGFQTLERTLAPLGHPINENGEFISANDPDAIHNFYAGAFNVNVSRKDGRVHIEKFINVQEALKSDRGKRLLDRIDELENSNSPRPIHTSVCAFVRIEKLDSVQTNAEDIKYTMIAHDLVFDHDAILLDTVASAQPGQGVGMAVNRKGKKIKVEQFILNHDKSKNIIVSLDMRLNQDDLSFDDLRQEIEKGLDRASIQYEYIYELFDDFIIFRSGEEFFKLFYMLDKTKNLVTIVDIPLLVDRNVTFTPKVNSKKGDNMKEMIIEALKTAKIETKNFDDKKLFEAYNLLQVNQNMNEVMSKALKTAKIETKNFDDKMLLEAYNLLQVNQPVNNDDAANINNDDAAKINKLVSDAVRPLINKISTLETTLNAQNTADNKQLVDIIINSGKFPGLDAESAKLLPLKNLQEMSASCGVAHGIPLVVNNFGSASDENFTTEMPK